VGSDGSPVDPELRGKVGERLTTAVAGHELVDLGLVEAALNGTPNRFQGRLRLTNIGPIRSARAAPGCRV
jgi:hypothetical protein